MTIDVDRPGRRCVAGPDISTTHAVIVMNSFTAPRFVLLLIVGGGGAGPSASGGTSAGLAAPPMGGVSASPNFMEQWRQPGAAVPLGQLADVKVTTGP